MTGAVTWGSVAFSQLRGGVSRAAAEMVDRSTDIYVLPVCPGMSSDTYRGLVTGSEDIRSVAYSPCPAVLTEMQTHRLTWMLDGRVAV